MYHTIKKIFPRANFVVFLIIFNLNYQNLTNSTNKKAFKKSEVNTENKNENVKYRTQ